MIRHCLFQTHFTPYHTYLVARLKDSTPLARGSTLVVRGHGKAQSCRGGRDFGRGASNAVVQLGDKGTC